MLFLKKEVEKEDEINLAASGLNFQKIQRSYFKVDFYRYINSCWKIYAFIVLKH